MSRRRNAVSGEQLIAKLGIDEYELSYLILKNNLTVLDPPKIPIFKRLLKPRYLTADSEELLEIIQNDASRLRQKLFLLAEVEKIPTKESLPSPPETESRVRYSLKDVPSAQAEPRTADTDARDSLIKVTIEQHESEIKISPNVFSLIGKVWFVKFKNQEWGLYPDQEKYKYIANLLSLSDENPKDNDLEYSIYNVDLMVKVKGKKIRAESPNYDEQDDLSRSDLAETFTSEELERLKEHGHGLLEELREARKSNDQKLVNETQNEISTYRSLLLKEYGIKTVISKDESRFSYKVLPRPGKENEKVRQLVKNQINNAIKDFRDRMPMFGTHLRHSLKTKSYETTYFPENQIGWHVSL